MSSMSTDRYGCLFLWVKAQEGHLLGWKVQKYQCRKSQSLRLRISDALVVYPRKIQDLAKPPRRKLPTPASMHVGTQSLFVLLLSLLVPSVLSVGGRTIRRCPSAPGTRRSSPVNIRCRISLIDTILPALWHTIRTLSSKAIPVPFAWPRVIAC